MQEIKYVRENMLKGKELIDKGIFKLSEEKSLIVTVDGLTICERKPPQVRKFSELVTEKVETKLSSTNSYLTDEEAIKLKRVLKGLFPIKLKED